MDFETMYQRTKLLKIVRELLSKMDVMDIRALGAILDCIESGNLDLAQVQSLIENSLKIDTGTEYGEITPEDNRKESEIL